MMDFIMAPLIVGIVCAGTYGLFELFARRKERMAIIEKIGDKLDTTAFEDQLCSFNYLRNFSFSSLKLGCLLTGIGLGLLVGFIIDTSLLSYHGADWYRYDIAATTNGASVLLFGGISLIIAFLVELKMGKKQDKAE